MPELKTVFIKFNSSPNSSCKTTECEEEEGENISLGFVAVYCASSMAVTLSWGRRRGGITPTINQVGKELQWNHMESLAQAQRVIWAGGVTAAWHGRAGREEGCIGNTVPSTNGWAPVHTLSSVNGATWRKEPDRVTCKRGYLPKTFCQGQAYPNSAKQNWRKTVVKGAEGYKLKRTSQARQGLPHRNSVLGTQKTHDGSLVPEQRNRLWESITLREHSQPFSLEKDHQELLCASSLLPGWGQTNYGSPSPIGGPGRDQAGEQGGNRKHLFNHAFDIWGLADSRDNEPPWVAWECAFQYANKQSKAHTLSSSGPLLPPALITPGQKLEN